MLWRRRRLLPVGVFFPGQTFFKDLNASSIVLLQSLDDVSVPLAVVVDVVSQLQNTSTGLPAVSANLSAIVDPNRHACGQQPAQHAIPAHAPSTTTAAVACLYAV